jgi:DNA gyrase subunit A
VPVTTYRSQQRGGKGIMGMETREEDSIDFLLSSWAHNDIYFFTNKGRVFSAKIYDLPAGSRMSKGQAIVNLLQLAPEEKVSAMLTIESGKDQSGYFMMATKGGTIKKTSISAYQNIRKTGIIAIKLEPKDELRFVHQTSGQDNIMIVTKNGQAIYFKEDDVRPMGRSAGGVRGIKLRQGDEVISFDVISSKNQDVAELLTMLENGFGKRTAIKKHFHLQNRGGIGVRATKVNSKTGSVVGSRVVSSNQLADVVLVSHQGQVIRIPLKSVKLLSRDTQGVTLMRLHKGDKVSSVALVDKSEIAET